MNARLCELSPQSGWPSFTPCQARFAPRRSWHRPGRGVRLGEKLIGESADVALEVTAEHVPQQRAHVLAQLGDEFL